jgi:hypothetical protein
MPRMSRAMARTRCWLLIALLGCGGGDSIAVSVEMTLDPGSCSEVPDPVDVTLSCTSTAGLWLRDGSGQILERGCIAVPSGSTLAALPGLLADIDLSTTSTDGISVDVALYGQWQASSGCPAPDELDGQAAPPEVIVSGTSAPVNLSGSSRRIRVELGCGAISVPGSTAMCEQQCADEQVACLDDSLLEQCDLMFEQCDEDCGPANDECEDACAEAYPECLLTAPADTCTFDLGICLQQCPEGDDACQVDCEGFHADCLDVECDLQADECETACAEGDGCASVSPDL